MGGVEKSKPFMVAITIALISCKKMLENLDNLDSFPSNGVGFRSRGGGRLL